MTRYIFYLSQIINKKLNENIKDNVLYKYNGDTELKWIGINCL